MSKLWWHWVEFSAESGWVIVLRTAKLLRGGLPAVDEAWGMATEKSLAMGQASIRATQGELPLAMALAYRRTVRSNLRRLSKPRFERQSRTSA